jgi:hypothetical protein
MQDYLNLSPVKTLEIPTWYVGTGENTGNLICFAIKFLLELLHDTYEFFHVFTGAGKSSQIPF